MFLTEEVDSRYSSKLVWPAAIQLERKVCYAALAEWNNRIIFSVKSTRSCSLFCANAAQWWCSRPLSTFNQYFIHPPRLQEIIENPVEFNCFHLQRHGRADLFISLTIKMETTLSAPLRIPRGTCKHPLESLSCASVHAPLIPGRIAYLRWLIIAQLLSRKHFADAICQLPSSIFIRTFSNIAKGDRIEPDKTGYRTIP